MIQNMMYDLTNLYSVVTNFIQKIKVPNSILKRMKRQSAKFFQETPFFFNTFPLRNTKLSTQRKGTKKPNKNKIKLF